jgi:peroxidase
LPQDLREKAGLTLLEKGFFQQYDATIDPTISNGFETVFQFSQSLAQGLVKMTDPQGRNESFKQIHSVVMNPFLLWAKGKLGELLRGASTQHAAQMDSYISGQVSRPKIRFVFSV